jgi:hypothetical protein
MEAEQAGVKRRERFAAIHPAAPPLAGAKHPPLSTPGATNYYICKWSPKNYLDKRIAGDDAGLYCFDTITRSTTCVTPKSRANYVSSFRARNMPCPPSRSIDTDQPRYRLSSSCNVGTMRSAPVV